MVARWLVLRLCGACCKPNCRAALSIVCRCACVAGFKTQCAFSSIADAQLAQCARAAQLLQELRVHSRVLLLPPRSTHALTHR